MFEKGFLTLGRLLTGSPCICERMPMHCRMFGVSEGTIDSSQPWV